MTDRVQIYLYVTIYSEVFHKKFVFIRSSSNTEIIVNFQGTCEDELRELKDSASPMNKETTSYVGNSRNEFVEICEKWLKKEEELIRSRL